MYVCTVPRGLRIVKEKGGFFFIKLSFLMFFYLQNTYIYKVCIYRICMVKRHTTLNIEDETLKKAKERLFNISEIAEEAINEKLGQKEVIIQTEITKCDFCGKEGEKATRDNLKGLTWLWPDERWICENCLIIKGRRII